MTDLALVLDGGWSAGLVLATTRVAAFLGAAPVLAKFVPVPGRVAFVVAVGLFLAEPVGGVGDVAALLGHGLMNAVVGVVLGFLTGLLFHMFATAGAVIDVTSNLSAATALDPTRGEQGAVFSRLFHLTGLTLFIVGGGLGVLVAGLDASVSVVPLDGTIRLEGGLAQVAVREVSRLMVVMVEIAMPVLTVLFITEVVLGLGARFAPQANVFLVGFPLKILVSLSVVTASVLLLPTAAEGYIVFVEETFTTVLPGIAP